MGKLVPKLEDAQNYANESVHLSDVMLLFYKKHQSRRHNLQEKER